MGRTYSTVCTQALLKKTWEENFLSSLAKNRDMEPKDFFLPIKIVAFDFDQTLVDEVASIRHRWKETLQEFSHIHKALEKTFFSIFDAKGPAYKAHLDDTLRELSLPESHIGPMVDFFRTTRSSKEFVYEHAREVVELLKERGFR